MVDCTKISSPITKYNSIHLMIALVAKSVLSIVYLDVKSTITYIYL